VAEAGLESRVEIQMGTLGKAFGASGGYICGSRRLIDLLMNRARSFIFSTAPIPAASAAASAALQIIQSDEGNSRRAALQDRARDLHTALGLEHSFQGSAILPFIIGEEAAALNHARVFFERRIFVPAIRYPSVARGQARLRFTVTSGHTSEDIQIIASALEACRKMSHGQTAGGSQAS
jgi:7-keto-8-aminopelargonate synthetase-like enzyme